MVRTKKSLAGGIQSHRALCLLCTGDGISQAKNSSQPAHKVNYPPNHLLPFSIWRPSVSAFSANVRRARIAKDSKLCPIMSFRPISGFLKVKKPQNGKRKIIYERNCGVFAKFAENKLKDVISMGLYRCPGRNRGKKRAP